MNPFKEIEYYKNHTRELIEESIILDPRPLDKFESNKMEEFWKLSKSEKLLEILHIIKKLLPENFFGKTNIKEKIYNTTELPFNPDKFKFKGLKGRGGQSQVYLLESLEKELPSYVLKMFRDTYIKKFFENSDEAGRLFKEELEKIMEWYSEDLHDIFLQEFLIKLKSPTLKKESLAILQPYQTGEIKDIFTEISKKELIELLNSDTILKEKFKKFVKETIMHAESTEETLDFLGDKNLSIIFTKDEEKLVILDPHHIYKTSDKENGCGEKCQEKLKYLKEVVSVLK
jgi:hypothetical protein